VLLVGAGFIGMEMSEAFRNLGIETQIFHHGTLPVSRWDLEFSKTVLAELERHEVGFVTNVEVRAVEEGKQYRLRLVTNRGEDEADMILIAVGVRPEDGVGPADGLAPEEAGRSVNFSAGPAGRGVWRGDCGNLPPGEPLLGEHPLATSPTSRDALPV
jgi:pyruvate/2-oxoglutarate dehydrogenase complex dihydrolipoamide dehydrogenase (E3) component